MDLFSFLYKFFDVLVNFSKQLWSFINFDLSKLDFFNSWFNGPMPVYAVLGVGAVITILINVIRKIFF